jgi:hypothetical protein
LSTRLFKYFYRAVCKMHVRTRTWSSKRELRSLEKL